MFGRLDELAVADATAEWAAEVGRLVRELGPAVSREADDPISIIRQLQESVPEATRLAALLDDKVLASKLARAGHALSRRLVVWEQVVRIGGPGPIAAEAPRDNPKELWLCLAKIDAITADSAQGRAWREYLLVDALRERSAGGEPEEGLSRTMARRALKRLTRSPMSTQQRRFVSSGPVAALQTELQRWAAEPVEWAVLLKHLERYETTGLASDARLLATDCRQLGLGPSGHRGPVRERLEANYRNSNLRAAVTGELLNRLMPELEPEHAPVRDVVLGTPVSGQSLTSTKVGVRLLSDPNRVRLALEVTGDVASLTSSSKGPVTFYNDGSSRYFARKPLEIGLKRIRLSRTEVDVHHDTRLSKVRTDLDEIPLFGGLLRNIARSQHARKLDEAGREVRQKVARMARQRIDSEVETRVGELSGRLRERVLDPLEALRLDATIIGAETTQRRLTVRLRLAGQDQLGGHTPRPRAPSDSLASFQVHETAINNMLERLALEGRTFTLPDLSGYVAGQLNCAALWEIPPEHENVTITFARQDALGVRLQDGRVVLSLSIAKLSKSPRRWKDFKVFVFYRPRVSGRAAKLVRDGSIQLGGQRTSFGEQVALRGIFSKTFSRRRLWKLTPERLATDPKLADVSVTQFVIEDGWIGLALGPSQVALGAAALRR